MASIVGIDPGTTTAVAVLDESGEIIAWTSQREFSRSDVSRFIISHGKPVIIATDVSPAPSSVRKMAATFGTVLYVPDDDLGRQEKERLIAGYETAEMDSHARDALAAAVRAYNVHQELIDRVVERVMEEEVEAEFDDILATALTETTSLEQILAENQPDEEEDETDEMSGHSQQVDWEKTAKRYREELKERREENRRLAEYKDRLEDRVTEQERELEELESEQKKAVLKDETVRRWKNRAENRGKRIRKLENRNRELENTIARYRQALGFVQQGDSIYPVCSDAEEPATVGQSIAFIRKNLRVEPPEHVKIVIVEKDEDAAYYQEHGIKTVDYRELQGMRLENYFIVDEKHVIETATEETEAFLEWLEDYRQRQQDD